MRRLMQTGVDDPHAGTPVAEPFFAPTPLHGAPQEHTPAYEPADLTSCDAEPIHVPGAIQPHGVLLALDSAQVVVMASANTGPMLGLPVDDVLGAGLASLLGSDVAVLVAASAADSADTDLVTTVLPGDHPGLTGSLAGARVDLRTHRSGERTVVEVEPIGHGTTAGLSLRSARRAIGRLAAQDDVGTLAAQLAEEVRALLGYDRVMVYRFDEDWNGEVVAENRRPDLNPFLGLHYPATDIPAQARRLYTVNWTRLIADVGYAPVPLEPVTDPGTGAPLDLSFSSLRSVSPIHLEYLGNMGVTASMSVSIVAGEELWGLVACHHYSGPHRPSQDARSAAELLGQVASQMFADRERAGEREAGIAVQERQSALLARIAADRRDPVDAMLDDGTDLMAMVGAGGVAVCDGSHRETRGRTPSWEVLERISAALDQPPAYASAHAHLAQLDPSLAGSAATAAGALRIGSAPDRWLLWLRPEVVETVDWGGDPTNKLLAELQDASVRLSPRKSFEKWQQVVRGRSRPWTASETAAAEGFGIQLQSMVMTRARDQVLLAESMQRSVVPELAPSVPGVEVAARYRPASTAPLGGDWWDVLPLGDGRTAFVVGDVAGHGVQAASTMVQLRTTLRAYLLDGHGAMASLDKLDVFIADLLPDQVATAVVAVLDPEGRTVSFARAGHPSPVVTGPAGAVLAAGGRPLLGVRMPDDTRADAVVRLDDGAALLLYTDGLVERRGEDLDRAVRDLADLRPGDGPLDGWLDEVLGSRRVDGSDDTTVLALRFTNERGT